MTEEQKHYLLSLIYKTIIIILICIIIVLLYCLQQAQGNKPLFSGTILENFANKIGKVIIPAQISKEELEKEKLKYRQRFEQARQKTAIKIKKLEEEMPKRGDNENLAAFMDYMDLGTKSSQISYTDAMKFHEREKKRRKK